MQSEHYLKNDFKNIHKLFNVGMGEGDWPRLKLSPAL